MKKTIPAAIVLLAAFYSPPQAHAQSIGPSTLNAAGGSATISGNTHEYSIGEEILLPTFTSGSLVVTSGVLQPVPFVTEGVENVAVLHGLEIFPNPVATDLTVAPAFGTRGSLEMVLFDAAGRLVRRTEAPLSTGSERQTIAMEALAASTYMLRLVWTADGAQPVSAAYTVQKVR